MSSVHDLGVTPYRQLINRLASRFEPGDKLTSASLPLLEAADGVIVAGHDPRLMEKAVSQPHARKMLLQRLPAITSPRPEDVQRLMTTFAAALIYAARDSVLPDVQAELDRRAAAFVPTDQGAPS